MLLQKSGAKPEELFPIFLRLSFFRECSVPRTFSTNLFQGIPHEINVCLWDKWQTLTSFFSPSGLNIYFIGFFLYLRKKSFVLLMWNFLMKLWGHKKLMQLLRHWRGDAESAEWLKIPCVGSLCCRTGSGNQNFSPLLVFCLLIPSLCVEAATSVL